MKERKTIGVRRSGWMIVAVLAALLMAGGAVRAQDAAQKSCDWHYDLAVFAWGSGLSGSVGPNINQQQVNASFSGIASHLDMAFMAHFEANNGTWGILVDPFYVNLGDDTQNGAGYPVHLDLKQLIGGLAGSYRLYQNPKSTFDLTFGLRYNELRTTIAPYMLTPQTQSISWTDPVLGFKGGVQMSKVWSFGYRADVGGFGVGSRLTWSGVVQFQAKVSKSCSLALGYLYYYVDYVKDAGRHDPGSFVYDMAQAGPILGVQFKF